MEDVDRLGDVIPSRRIGGLEILIMRVGSGLGPSRRIGGLETEYSQKT